MITKEILLLAEQGDNESQAMLADYYFSIKGYQSSFYYMNLSAQNGNIEAIRKLGQYYYSGIGVQINHKKAYDCFKRCAKLGDEEGLVLLAEMIVEQNIGFMPKKRAVKLLRMAAKKGNRLAYYKLGLAYVSGVGVNKNVENARLLLVKSATQGFAPAINELNSECFSKSFNLC